MRFDVLSTRQKFKALRPTFMSDVLYTKVGPEHAEWDGGVDHFFPDELVTATNEGIDFAALIRDVWDGPMKARPHMIAVSLEGATLLGVDTSEAPEGSFCLMTEKGISFPVEE